MEIQIIVPWGSDGNLGAAYNRLMENVKDWVCFLDHDILHLNPNWYHMCKAAIKSVGHTAGWITGVTNAIACPDQLRMDAPKGGDIYTHMHFAKHCYKEHGDKLTLIDTDTMPLEFSGFMILTHKEAWEAAGGFDDGFLGVDNYYFRKLIKNDYKAYVMPGLYMYHLYGGKKQWDNY
jgi:GT2 family glycosyltransferase